jgi:hypothetical protein
MTKTNINLIVNGTKVYTRKTTGRPYTHALVIMTEKGWQITSCSSTGTAALQRQIDETTNVIAQYEAMIAKGEDINCYCTVAFMTRRVEAYKAAQKPVVLPIIDNTVTLVV